MPHIPLLLHKPFIKIRFVLFATFKPMIEISLTKTANPPVTNHF